MASAEAWAALFLSALEGYDGGELVVEDTFGSQSVKLAAGCLILYQASSLHRVEPVTRDCRLASFFWTEACARRCAAPPAVRSRHVHPDPAILRSTEGDTPQVVRLTGCSHKLLRMWTDT